MAGYKDVDTQPRFLPIDLARQLQPGTFEHALNHLLDRELDLSGFDARFCNDAMGASAYPPALLLKVVLFAYSRGIVSSRAMAAACREQVTFMALTGDRAPHFTTLAGFVRGLGDDIARIFTQVLYVCDRQGLIGREMFAIDGVKLPSSASKARSGTRAEFERQAAKLERAVQSMLERHRAADRRATEPDVVAKEGQRIERLKNEVADLRRWLRQNPAERRGSQGTVRKSTRTDAESAKMATSKGVIQGYTGVAAVDGKHQIIVEARAHGTGSEQELLVPVVRAMQGVLATNSMISADAGYHSGANLQQLADLNISALSADNGMRKRDERFATQGRYQTRPDPLHDKSPVAKPAKLYTPKDFDHDPAQQTCVCPAGKTLYRNGSDCVLRGYAAVKFRGTVRDCVPCDRRERCLRSTETSRTRQVAFFKGKAAKTPVSHTDLMKQRIDTPEGRAQYGRRFAIVEPVFANIRHNKRLDRFTLRSRVKVNAEWQLFCLAHNIEKLAHQGYAQ